MMTTSRIEAIRLAKEAAELLEKAVCLLQKDRGIKSELICAQERINTAVEVSDRNEKSSKKNLTFVADGV